MFTKLLELNRIIEGEKQKNIIERLNQGLDEAYTHGIAICFDFDSGKYVGLRMVQGSRDVVYMKPAPNGFSSTAVQPIGSDDSSKTVAKLQRSVQALSNATTSVKEKLQIVTANYDEAKILDDLKLKVQGISTSRDTRVYLFVAFIAGDILRPLYLEPEVQDNMVRNALEQYGNVKKNQVVEADHACYVCGEADKKVYGNFARLKSYNLDKIGMITGGFSYEQTSKNFPVCEECITAVSSAYDFANDNLNFPLCGERYLLLPSLQTKDDDLADMIVQILKGRGRAIESNELEKITNAEKEILEELAMVGGGKDVLTLTFVFFEEKQASWKITGEIPEVLPSRISKIYDAKRFIEDNRYLGMGDKPFRYTFKSLQKFAGSSGKPSRRKFMEYINAVFAGSTLDEKTVVTDMVRTILTTSKSEPQYLPFTVRDAFATLLFLGRLNILRKGERRMDNKAISTNNPYDKFIREHQSFFDAREKVVAFLTGSYISKVLYAQGANLGSSPFFKKLRGLKIDRKRLQTLYPESRNKIHQYDAFGLVKDIDSLLAQAWVDCGNRRIISDDESTLAFTLGLSLDYNINTQI